MKKAYVILSFVLINGFINSMNQQQKILKYQPIKNVGIAAGIYGSGFLTSGTLGYILHEFSGAQWYFRPGISVENNAFYGKFYGNRALGLKKAVAQAAYRLGQLALVSLSPLKSAIDTAHFAKESAETIASLYPLGVEEVLQRQPKNLFQQLKLIDPVGIVKNGVKRSRYAVLGFGLPYVYGKYQQQSYRSME